MKDPFDTLALPPRFDLDPLQLESRFLAASSLNHPDRFTDPLDQADAADRMAHLTAAYRTLKDPEQRANALLARLGGPAKEDDKSLPPDLLMDMMEVREELENAIDSNNTAELNRLRQWASQRQAQHEQQIAKRFAQSPSLADLKTIRLELNALRYIQRMLDQMPPA